MVSTAQQAALQRLLTAAQNLPASMNPYTFIEEHLYALMVPKVSPDFFITLHLSEFSLIRLGATSTYANTDYGIAAVGVLFGLIVLGVKYLGGNLWLLRRKDVQFGVVYFPNVMALLALFNTVYFCCEQIACICWRARLLMLQEQSR